MWSFLLSAGLFIALVLTLGVWQFRTRKTSNVVAMQVDQEITRAAEIAQRRHVQRFGTEDKELREALSTEITPLRKAKTRLSS